MNVALALLGYDQHMIIYVCCLLCSECNIMQHQFQTRTVDFFVELSLLNKGHMMYMFKM